MFTKEMSVKEILADPEIQEFVPGMVVNWDISKNYPYYDLPLEEAYQKEGGWNYESLLSGMNKLLAEKRKGNGLIQLYTDEEIQADPKKAEARMVWFPSDDPKASEKPYIIVVPGGGYVNVWNISEGYPIAAHFNQLGFHAFILTYRVVGPKLLPAPTEDFAQALKVIKNHQEYFGVQWDNYLATGFSAGAHLISTWGMDNHGYSTYGMPKPAALFPIYAPISWKLCLEDEDHDGFAISAIGMTVKEAAASDWNIDEHVENFPPSYIVCTEDDELVNPEHSRRLKRALDAAGVPAELEIGARGHHGFGEGRDADTWGWIERAAAFYEKVK